MYLGSRDLRQLETMVQGYYFALWIHGIVEDRPNLLHLFSEWLNFRFGWNRVCGWAEEIQSHCDRDSDPLDEFFRLFDEYKKTKLIIRASVRLRSIHQPTGKRVVIGMNGRVDKPDEVAIVQLWPTRLHMLRFRYGSRIVEQRVLTKSTGKFGTLRDAKEWVRDELQVAYNEWRPAARKRT